jgi:hypothetical protein
MSTTVIGGMDFWGFTALKRVVSEVALAALFIATFCRIHQCFALLCI